MFENVIFFLSIFRCWFPVGLDLKGLTEKLINVNYILQFTNEL